MKKNYVAPEFEELLINSVDDILTSTDQPTKDPMDTEPPNIQEALTPSGGTIKDNPMIG